MSAPKKAGLALRTLAQICEISTSDHARLKAACIILALASGSPLEAGRKALGDAAVSPWHRKRIWIPAHSEAAIKILDRCRDDLLKLNPDAPFWVAGISGHRNVSGLRSRLEVG
ncbi:hypothetical protein [Aquabacter sp. CN5-332]|uniref:hypothetical protein n=1 Tax=Aquabacter sp. CN5-332 TaxID=3156608 RepID=UPI0032B3186C